MIKSIEVLSFFKYILNPESSQLLDKVQIACQHNPWFVQEDYMTAISNISTYLLNEETLLNVRRDYPQISQPKTIGLVLAGNIPLVGMHDIISAILAGHHLKMKLSEKDELVYQYMFEQLQEHFPDTVNRFQIVDKLQEFDAIIATGSNNSSRYFEYYFGKYPHIIRKNRNGIAILDGQESEADLLKLGEDIFLFFGLGCRNVSKLYVPANYDFTLLLERLRAYGSVIEYAKYKHNFDYNLTLQIMNNHPYLSNDHLLFLEDMSIPSRIATIHYEYYNDDVDLLNKLESKMNEIQCVVSNKPIGILPSVRFGYSQKPHFTDYADGVDTMEFLTNLA